VGTCVRSEFAVGKRDNESKNTGTHKDRTQRQLKPCLACDSRDRYSAEKGSAKMGALTIHPVFKRKLTAKKAYRGAPMVLKLLSSTLSEGTFSRSKQNPARCNERGKGRCQNLGPRVPGNARSSQENKSGLHTGICLKSTSVGAWGGGALGQPCLGGALIKGMSAQGKIVSREGEGWCFT